jgi:antitoxin HicB
MLNEWHYTIEIRTEAGEYHAYCEDLPEAIAAGPTEVAALHEMRQAIVAAVRGRMKDGMDLSPPAVRGGGSHIELPPQLAAKAAVYSAWRASGLTKVAFGERIGRGETEVRRILDPDYGTKLDQLGEAAAALGGRLSVSFTPS